MGKNQRHKKDIKAEKGKTKLKQTKTKFLPKGLNVTDTSFKVKPIVLVEQLRHKDSDDILSRRKLNVKDLLSRLRHYNENVRRTACVELSDLVKSYTGEIIQQHLSQICLAISGLMQDREPRIRKAAVKAVEAILNNVPSEKLTPFFEFFTTNLRCAMTNIDTNIQEDSLLFLDCFVNRDCTLIARASEKLLPDFLALISKLRNDSEIGRTLTLNLGSKLTSVEWRIKVLSRLHAIFRIILAAQLTGSHGAINRFPNSFQADQIGHFALYKDGLLSKLEVADLDMFSMGNITSCNEPDSVNRHILTLVPLLYETWLEVRPDRKAPAESSILTQEAGSLLACIINTLHMLWRYVKAMENDDINLKSVFLGPEGRKFLAHLLGNFPYSHSGTRPKRTKSSVNILEHNTDPKCVRENLLICFLYLELHVNWTQKNLEKEMTIIYPYLKKILSQKRQLREESAHCLLELLAECFGTNYRKWQRSGIDLQVLLEDVVACYRADKVINEHNKLRLCEILAGIAENPHLGRSVAYENWLSTLPDILCQPSAPEATIVALLKLAQENCRPFQAAFLRKLPEILVNLGNLQITSSENDDAARRSLSNIFYYMPSYSEEETRALYQFIESCPTSIGEFIRQVLLLRLKSK